jgi:predicted DNA-binding protein
MRKMPCRECQRPIFTTIPHQPHICNECAARVQAQRDLDNCTDATQREAIVAYIEQLRDAALAKGGKFIDHNVQVLKPEREAAYLPDGLEAAQARRKPKRKPKPKAEAPKRPRGRPALSDATRMVTYAQRLPPAVKDKLDTLGKDWLILAVMKARIATLDDEPAQSPVQRTG